MWTKIYLEVEKKHYILYRIPLLIMIFLLSAKYFKLENPIQSVKLKLESQADRESKTSLKFL